MIARVKSAKFLNAPDISTTQGYATAPSPPCSSAVRCAGARWRRSADGRSSGGFTPEATVAARQAHDVQDVE